MIVTENLYVDGKEYIRTYSSEGVYLEREGARYSEAIDPVELNREYTETDEVIVYEGEVTEDDYSTALAEFGVKL